jgi:membrane-bound lytic murein transglycosylase D
MKRIALITAGFMLLVFISFLLFPAFGEKENSPADFPSPVYTTQLPPVFSVEIPQHLTFAGEEAPLDNFLAREYLDRELISNTYFHSSTIMLFKRANRWFPIIEPILAQHNVPDDFKYLALIESGLENVVSPAGAAGVWQFLTHTAREYGLEVNSGIDERYNLEKSTDAACRYLQNSYQRYNNWTLAAAAYNAGNNRISRAIEKQQVSIYYDLFLNIETARYLFRILAIKTIFENPEKYGFYLDDQDLFPPIPVRKVVVTQTIPDLMDFAREHNITYKVLKYFNPWLRQEYLPNNSRRTYHVSIPLEGHINYSTLRESEPSGNISSSN